MILCLKRSALTPKNWEGSRAERRNQCTVDADVWSQTQNLCNLIPTHNQFSLCDTSVLSIPEKSQSTMAYYGNQGGQLNSRLSPLALRSLNKLVVFLYARLCRLWLARPGSESKYAPRWSAWWWWWLRFPAPHRDAPRSGPAAVELVQKR